MAKEPEIHSFEAHKKRIPDMQNHLEDLRQDVSKLRTDLSDLTKNLLDLGKDEAVQVKDNLLENGKKLTELMETKLKEKPMTTLLSAFAVGLVLGVLWKR